MKPATTAPIRVATVVILLVCLARLFKFEWAERLERLTYDMRARTAVAYSPTVSTNLGFVFINEESVKAIADGSLGYRFGWEWPRQVYGRVLSELNHQGAKAVALDIILGELRPDHAPVRLSGGTNLIESDEYFAAEMGQAGNVILALTPEVIPPDLFLTNAWALGDITTERDEPEGILRRVKAFRTYRFWHPAFRQLADSSQYGVDLQEAIIEPRQIVLPRRHRGLEDIRFPLDEQGQIDLADFWGDRLASGISRKAKPFTEQRVWHMGIVLAARELGLDLDQSIYDPGHGRLILKGRNNLTRTIPIDKEGYFYVDWCMPENDPHLLREAFHELLAQHRARILGHTNNTSAKWRGKLAVIGSSALVGNNLTDRGATPLRADTILVGKHWNVANSVLLNRFIRRSDTGLDLVCIVVIGLLSAVFTWRLRVLTATIATVLLLVGYVVAAVAVYVASRFWMPVILPVLGAQLMTYTCLMLWRVLFEQAQRRHLRSIFSAMVSPKIVTELLRKETLVLGGARRGVSVLFADVRGFTALMDSGQSQVAMLAREQKLSPAATEAAFDSQAQETLRTVNVYLGLVAEIVLKNDGTHDKFIGDCVMAFWGAPSEIRDHAPACVRAAVEIQRAIAQLNSERKRQNQLPGNQAAAANGAQPILLLGIGINTGPAIVGLMGSESRGVVRQGNYTVFGREVNLASRLEAAAAGGQIYIGENTYKALLRTDAEMAAHCVPLVLPAVKGFTGPVRAYVVHWEKMPLS